MRNQEREEAAGRAAGMARKFLSSRSGEYRPMIADANHNVPIGLVLGTGWGDALQLDAAKGVQLYEIPGFESLGKLEGHSRMLLHGVVEGQEVFALQGRVHLNEAPANSAILEMVRLQVEMMFQFGVKKLILTSAAGSLREDVKVGDLVIVDGFVTAFAPPMPLYAGEFCSPEDTLVPYVQNNVAVVAGDDAGISTKRGGYAMVRGPFFEGRKYDKPLLRNTGASVVGMSMLPEACIAALYNVEVLGVSFVTNSAVEEHSHEDNLARAKQNSPKLGTFLRSVIRRWSALVPDDRW